MLAVLRFFISTPFLTCLVTAILSAVIWFFGPLIAVGNWRPLDGFWERTITIGVLWVFVLLILIIRAIVRRRKARALTAEIIEVDPREEAVSAEIQELKGKFRAALQQLRSSKSGQAQLHELPWYVIIGPPGAGKTTAIVNSGLKFPVETSKGAVGGVGGTRNCDWWFTNDAVLIDTAGRYTTQESDAEADNKAWLGFLSILKRYRTRQPINGVMVAISLSDLSNQDSETQMSHARAIRRRILELREELGIRYPIYVLFTKADLIAGFSEFFEPLDADAREQVWGFTFDLAAAKEAAPLDVFDEEFAALLARLNAQSLERVQGERDPQRRSLIAGFPSQVASLRTVARDFLAETFQDSKFEDRLPLRGVYLTSGTQEGTPIDRLMMGMARTFGIGRQSIGTGKGTGKSFFITRLLRDVIFPEAGLVSRDDKVERRFRWVTRLSIAAALLVSIGLGTLWTRSFLENRALVAEAEETLVAYQTAAAQIPSNPISDTDLTGVVPALNLLREMPGNAAVEGPPPGLSLGFGLYQGDVIGTNAAQAYRAALNQHLLPRLILRLEEQIAGNLNQPEFLYEALKVYLTLGLQAPYVDKDLVRDWMAIDWQITYPDPVLQAELRAHLEALIAQPMTRVELNGPLVLAVQEILIELPLAERIYQGILTSVAASDLAPWRIIDIGGPAASRVLIRSSGRPLSDGIEGIYTYDGFHDVFLEEALGVARRVQNESWVLGDYAAGQQSEAALVRMSRDVLDLYYTDYIDRYEGILGDIDIVPLESLSQAVAVTNVLSGPTSPIRNVLIAIADETRLTEDRSVLPSDAAAEGGSVLADEALREVRGRRAQVFLETVRRSDPGADPVTEVPGYDVENRFAFLQDLVRSDAGAPTELDGIIDQLQEVNRELNRVSINNSALGFTSDEGSALSRFQETVSRLEGPLKRWADQIASGSSGITADGTRAQLNARWQAQVAPFCAQALEGRYPFNPQARQEVTIQDFSRAFAPGGLIDKFFNENLLRFVDTSTRPWTFKTVNQAELGISDAVLKQFENAGQIRDTFFAGAAAPSIPFEITPFALDPSAQSMTLSIDGQEVTLATGQTPTPKAVRWPGEFGLARFSFAPPSNTVESSIERDGPWAWFRLLGSAALRDTPDGQKKRINFNVGGRIGIFELRMGSAFNPFTLPALTQFSCPKSL
ncbi:MAG: type VI secretion system membrane subunit TssM [Pseudomonadota bacterium]